jgi:hypothetical protein
MVFIQYRLFWDQSAHNRAKLTNYRNRIEELEGALRLAHSVVSHEPHPLLSQVAEKNAEISETFPGSYDTNRARSSVAQHDNDETPQSRDTHNVYGSLSSNGSSGETAFFGHAAAGWVGSSDNYAEFH